MTASRRPAVASDSRSIGANEVSQATPQARTAIRVTRVVSRSAKSNDCEEPRSTPAEWTATTPIARRLVSRSINAWPGRSINTTSTTTHHEAQISVPRGGQRPEPSAIRRGLVSDAGAAGSPIPRRTGTSCDETGSRAGAVGARPATRTCWQPPAAHRTTVSSNAARHRIGLGSWWG